jgi:hypothetical protein
MIKQPRHGRKNKLVEIYGTITIGSHSQKAAEQLYKYSRALVFSQPHICYRLQAWVWSIIQIPLFLQFPCNLHV